MIITDALTLLPNGTAERKDIVIQHGHIAALVSPGEGHHWLAHQHARHHARHEAQVIHGTRRLAMPGLVNAHVHSNENFLKGRLDNLPLEVWLNYSYPVLAAPPQSPRTVYIRTLLSAIEMLKTGTTCVVDMVYEFPQITEETAAAVFEAYRDAGMRAVVLFGMENKPYHEILPLNMEKLRPDLKTALADAPLRTTDEWLSFCEAQAKRWNGTAHRLTLGLGPSGPQRCTDDFLQGLAALASDLDAPLHIHTLETRMQVATGRLFYGRSLVEHLARLNFLSHRSHLIHAVWLSPRDIDLVGEYGAGVIHNPLSNLKLGSGVAPVPTYLERGINVALGTDGKSSNDSQDLFEVTKITALLHKLHHPEFRDWITARQAFAMATAGGARAAGLERDIGVLEVGRRADLVLLDLDTPPFTPLNNPVNHLVYCNPGSSVREVIVQGELVVKEGRLTGVNEQAVYAEANELAAKFIEDSREAWEIAALIEPSVRDSYIDIHGGASLFPGEAADSVAQTP